MQRTKFPDEKKFSNLSSFVVADYPLFKLDSFSLFLGNACFLYLISNAILPIEQTMRRRRAFDAVFLRSMSFITLLNVVFAVLAYWLYGEDTQGNVLCNVSDGLGAFSAHAR